MVLLVEGFWISSPKFLTIICSPSEVKLIVVIGTNLEMTPVILNSTFLDVSPFSYPKITSSDLISSAVLMVFVTPEQFKNWFIVLPS